MSAVGRREFRALGTGCVVLLTDASKEADALAAVDAELTAIDIACSRFRVDSELSSLNRRAGRRTRISPLLAEALGEAIRAAQLTDGDLDPTVGSSLRVLGYDRDFATITPSDSVLTVTRARGWRVIELDVDRRTVRIPTGVSLDLGATAKAWAADRAARAAADATGSGVLVSLGGDLSVAGPAPDGGWTVLIADSHDGPLDAPGQRVAIIDGAIATSSTMVRRWRHGTEVHHIVQPSTGMPVPEHWRTVSVAASSCLDANIASTTAVIRGPGAVDWLDALGLAARLVRVDGTVEVVGGWPRDDRMAA